PRGQATTSWPATCVLDDQGEADLAALGGLRASRRGHGLGSRGGEDPCGATARLAGGHVCEVGAGQLPGRGGDSAERGPGVARGSETADRGGQGLDLLAYLEKPLALR